MNSPVRGTDAVVDCAGGTIGGAGRFLQELDGYILRHPGAARLIGRSRHLGAGWLLARELAARNRSHRVAINNVSFARAGGCRTVLLRNALHFLSAEERRRMPVGRLVGAEAAVVRQLVRFADRIVVPSSTMADRVTCELPHLAHRITVMPHPVSRAPAAPGPMRNAVLCPVLDAPYKMLHRRLPDLVWAVGELRRERPNSDLELLLTLTGQEAAALGVPVPPWVRLLGRLAPPRLQEVQRQVRVIAYPTVLESFGYPLAEARLARRAVVAPQSDHAVEVAGDALVGYRSHDRVSLREAVRTALDTRLEALLTNPFDPDAYFAALLSSR